MPECLGHEYRSIGCWATPTITLPCGHKVCDECADLLIVLDVIRSREDPCLECIAAREQAAAWNAGAKDWTGSAERRSP